MFQVPLQSKNEDVSPKDHVIRDLQTLIALCDIMCYMDGTV